MFGCSNNEIQESSLETDTAQTDISTSQSSSDDTFVSETTIPATADTTGTTKKGSKATTTTTTTITTTGNKAKSTATTTHKKSNNTSASKSTTAGTTKKQSTTSATVNCTVTVECKSILNHMDNLKAGHEDFVPSGGVFFSNYSVTVKNGASAYDAVKLACNSNGVSINATSSTYGIYVAGFGNIDEKDCGNQSGWTYTVNGKYISKSCGKYTVSNGDNIVFSYTCSYK